MRAGQLYNSFMAVVPPAGSRPGGSLMPGKQKDEANAPWQAGSPVLACLL